MTRCPAFGLSARYVTVKGRQKNNFALAGQKKTAIGKSFGPPHSTPGRVLTSTESGGTKNAADAKSTLQNADVASLLDLGDGVFVVTLFIEDASGVEVVAREMLSANPGCNEVCDFSQKSNRCELKRMIMYGR